MRVSGAFEKTLAIQPFEPQRLLRGLPTKVTPIIITSILESFPITPDLGLWGKPCWSGATNGGVTLVGQVDSAELKTHAEAVAKGVPKVVRVINNLQVATSPQSP